MADEDKPGPETVTLSELSSADKQGQGKAVDLARQLSAIMIIDMLTAQWDRWSGGNIQAIVVNGNMKIVAFDNGGTFKYSSALLDNYLAIVTRFDKKTADILRKMDRFLNKKTEKLFLNYTSEDELRNFLGVISGPDNLSNADWIWRRFKRNLAIIIAHIEKSEQIYGPDRCYF